MTPDDAAEMKALLREIRDLQQAHFDRYKLFTERLLASDEAAKSATAQRAKDDEIYLREQQAYQDEMRNAVRMGQQNVFIATIVLGVVFMLMIAMLFLPALIAEVS